MKLAVPSLSKIARLFVREETPQKRAGGINNPAIGPSDPSFWMGDDFSFMTDSGEPVGPRAALSLPAVWAAVSLISETVAKLPFEVRRVLDRGGSELATDHHAANQIRFKPNRIQKASDWYSLVVHRVLLHGNAFAQIRRRPDGRLHDLIPLANSAVQPILEIDGTLETLRYVVTYGTKSEVVDAADILHFRGVGDEIMGWSTVRLMARSFGVGLATQAHTAFSFRNRLNPSVVLMHPGPLSEEAQAKIRGAYAAYYGGAENSGRALVLEEGMTALALQIKHTDAQLLETRQFSVREIANAFKIPPHMLGDDTKDSYRSLEEEEKRYAKQTIDPILCQIETEFADKILGPRERWRYCVKADRSLLEQANMEQLHNAFSVAVGRPYMTANEARERIGLAPNEDGEALAPPINAPDHDSVEGGESGASNDGKDDDGERALEEEVEELRGLVAEMSAIGDDTTKALETATAREEEAARRSIEIKVANEGLLRDVAIRALKRIRSRASKASGSTGRWIDFMGSFEASARCEVQDLAAPGIAAFEAARGKRCEAGFAETFVRSVYDRLDECAGLAEGDGLRAGVETAFDDMMATTPDRLIAAISGD